ncbi:MAG TPA: GWxTD domain-containing protein [candidate division Zixibacteria bacterium]|jgi:GWxTD domain-containing protein
MKTCSRSRLPAPAKPDALRMNSCCAGWFCALTVLLLPAIAAAVDGPGAHQFWTDAAVFRMSDESRDGYVEFYFEIKRSTFVFRPTQSGLRADVATRVRITDREGRAVDSAAAVFAAMATDSSDLADADYTLFFAMAIDLPPGRYSAQVDVTDLADSSSSKATYPVIVPDFSGDTLMLSEIQLGYDIQLAADTAANLYDVLVKNGYKTYPDCRGLVSESRTQLYFYCESYNLSYSPTSAADYTVGFSIVPTDGTPARSLGVQHLKKPGPSTVLASHVTVDDLSSGVYRLRLEVSDPATAQHAVVEKPFQVLRPMTDSLTVEEVERVRDIIAFIARPGELTAFDQFDARGKLSFLIQFWRERDPSPDTPINEYRDEHMRRMNYANDQFSIGFRERSDGWRTDRGRVYIVYGPPTEIKRYPFTPDFPAAIHWVYDNIPNQGSADFLFLDEAGFGDYRLVHSSARGERRDPNWEYQLQIGAFEGPTR